MENNGLYKGKSQDNIQKETLHPKQQESSSNLKNKVVSILVAEDNKQNQRVLELLIIQKFPASDLYFVSNGQELLEELDQQSYDMVFLDIGMPKMNGFQAIKIIRGKGSEIPVIALTASAEIGTEQECLDAGCDDYITKPVDINKLYSIIEQYS